MTSRIGPGQTVQDVVRSLENTCSTTQQRYPDLTYSITIDKVDAMPAFSVPKDAYIVKRLNKMYSEIRPESPPQPTGALAPQCFYGSDAGHLYKSLGMEGVVCGPGGKYNTMPDERVEVSHAGNTTADLRSSTISTVSGCSSDSSSTFADDTGSR